MQRNLNFIVTTSVGGSSKTQVWNPALPLALGHPLRWIAERTPSGVRVRSLSARPGEIAGKDALCEIPLSKLASMQEIELPHSRGVRLTIRPAVTQAPAYGTRGGDKLSIYACAGSWVASSGLFKDRYLGHAGKQHVFSMREKAGTYSFDIHVEGMRLIAGDEPARALPIGQAAHVQGSQITDAVLSYGTYSWRFSLGHAVAIKERAKITQDAESQWFSKALRGACVGFGALMVITWLWPAPKPEDKELIPAQFAKIILAKPPTSEVKATASEGSQTQQAAVPEKVQKAAVVQAFRAKALSSAVSGLLKGGMTNLLAQSDFVAGKSNEARKMFDTKSSALSTATPTANAPDTNRAIASIGGSGEGKGAGYGKGEKAGVKGQGQAFVSMDIAGAAVDEGLTKDEVGEVIHRHLSEVRYCYESAMTRTPDLEGKLMVNFTIGGNGVVKSTEVKSSTLPDPRLDDCILRRLATWKFPNPRGGIDVSVGYPFIFKKL